MFNWISIRRRSYWTRDTRWSPLLENQRDFQRTLAKERSRVDRHGGRFGVVILSFEPLSGVRRQAIQLARLLHRRLRDTDSKGHISYGRIGVLLPCTGATDTHRVMEDLVELASKHGLLLDGEAYVYPDDHQDDGRQSSTRAGHENADQQSLELETAAGLHTAIQSSQTQSKKWHHIATNAPLLKEPRAKALPAEMLTAPYPAWKRGLDVLGAVVGIIAFAPFLLLSALLIKLTSRGPVLFRQPRTGYLGKTFTIYKFRSMVVNAESMRHSLEAGNERDGPAFKMKCDPRVTRIGRLLRATGLDELPQFYNVLRGDMSLVGPRPLPVFEADACSSWQKQRHLVKPGLTCYWQLIKSRQVPFDTWMRLDMHYAKRPSLQRDLRLILKTFASVFLGRVGH